MSFESLASVSLNPVLTFDTWGSIFIGLLVSTSLFGVLCLQSYQYYQLNYEDPMRLKSLVGFLFGLNTFHIIMISYGTYTYLVTDFVNPIALEHADWPYIIHIIVNCLIAAIVQFFFADRVWRISKGNRILTGLILTLSVLQLAFGIVVTIRSFHPALFSFLKNMRGDIATSLSSTVACDVLITGGLLYFLDRGRTGFKKTDSIITNLMWFSLSTGLLPAIFAVIQLITFIAMPDNFVNIGISLFLGKLYANSLLATLNGRATARQKWASHRQTVHLTDLPSSSSGNIKANVINAARVAGGRDVKSNPSHEISGVAIYVSQEVKSDHDVHHGQHSSGSSVFEPPRSHFDHRDMP
ncbi:hypothetical protein BD410DRAFT_791695 [Rickenella mellea]|uniref:DUF6534 domain-containing protein n=1 Tax=Rickenella mellea TaxID=50990 RepID=A0A4Y7PZ46_9AGAM|nr:hypothetical protein BD410DRAFT_791695 [Rickenella mellea]